MKTKLLFWATATLMLITLTLAETPSRPLAPTTPPPANELSFAQPDASLIFSHR